MALRQAVHRVTSALFLGLALAGCGGGEQAHDAQANASVLTRVNADSLWLPISIVSAIDSETGEQRPNVLILRNHHRLVVNLYSAAVIGTLPREDLPPLLVVSAVPCGACDENRALFFVPADADSIGGDIRPYAFPGALRQVGAAGDDTTPTFRARVFLGTCLDPARKEVVWFESTRDSTQRWITRVFHVAVSGDSALGEYLDPRPGIDSALGRVQAGGCRELPGLDQPA